MSVEPAPTSTTPGVAPLPRLIGHQCFACGTANPHGLHMRFAVEGETVRSEVTLSADHAGWVHMAHGGIVSTLLDEIMAWSVIAFRRRLFVTRKMDVRFRAPVPLGVPLVVRGGLDDRKAFRGQRAWGRIEDPSGRVLADSRGEMTYVDEAWFGDMDSLVHDDMVTFFELLDAPDPE